MLQFQKLSDDVSISMQVFPEQLDFIAKSDFKSIINNRPDMEKPGQPFASDIEKMAQECGLSYAHIPMQPGQLSVALIDAMVKAFDELPKPILAYCASGMRSATLWCFANVKDMGVDGVISAAAAAGMDVEKIRPALSQYALS
ncbi:MAG: TIGR01244 family phosphatase [Robiginitomaculum sp.]|nr:MAG: TIGR01244 family phosphatase [Robiginitomaculum sp.]